MSEGESMNSSDEYIYMNTIFFCTEKRSRRRGDTCNAIPSND